MQCGSCQFENMPGIEVCGRCGARLDLADETLDVHPPRAGRWEKRLGWCRTPLFWRSGRLRELLSTRIAPLESGVPAGAFPRTVVPGWPQFYCGHSARGKIFFWGYLVSAALSLAVAATDLGPVLFGLPLSIHAGSILDVVFAATGDLQSRLIYSALWIVLIAVIVYLPLGWLLLTLSGETLWFYRVV
jgi:hypothetical protein